MPPSIASIVEGEGDEEALPVLVRRILFEQDAPGFADVRRPLRVAKGKLVLPSQLERYVEFAASQIAAQGAILVVIDSDGDLPCMIGPELLARAKLARSDAPIAIILAHCEWESWYLAAAESLAGRRGLRPDITSPEHPETIRGAKEWLTRHMQSGKAYSPIPDQAALAASLDLQAARRAPSFDKFYREVVRLFRDASALQHV
jgi:hypothetical protein